MKLSTPKPVTAAQMTEFKQDRSVIIIIIITKILYCYYYYYYYY